MKSPVVRSFCVSVHFRAPLAASKAEHTVSFETTTSPSLSSARISFTGNPIVRFHIMFPAMSTAITLPLSSPTTIHVQFPSYRESTAFGDEMFSIQRREYLTGETSLTGIRGHESIWSPTATSFPPSVVKSIVLEPFHSVPAMRGPHTIFPASAGSTEEGCSLSLSPVEGSIAISPLSVFR